MDQSTYKKERLPYLDTLRMLATYGVIFIHVSTPALKMSFGSAGTIWMTANVLDSAVRCIVPIFLMLTGATLLNRVYDSTIEFYKRRLKRVLFPFLFWVIIYLIYNWFTLPGYKQPDQIHSILDWASKQFMDLGVSKHFWYFYMISFVYLFIPLLSNALNKISRQSQLAMIIVWSVICFLTRNINMNVYSWHLDAYLSKAVAWVLHSGYLLVGLYLVNIHPFNRKKRLLFLIIYIITIVICSVLTWYFSKGSRNIDLSMYGYLKTNTIVQSIAFFLMFKDLNIRNRIWNWVQQQICTYSYSIYLAHMLVLNFLFDRNFYWKIAHPVFSVPLVAFCALIVAYGINFFIRKIPFGTLVTG